MEGKDSLIQRQDKHSWMPVPVISFLMTEPPIAHMTQESILIRRSPLASDWALANETWVGLLGAFLVRFLCSKKRTGKGSDISLPAAGVIPFSLLLRLTTNQTSITKKAWLPSIQITWERAIYPCPWKWVRCTTEDASRGELLGSERWQRQWLMGRELGWPYLTKEVEGEREWGSAPHMFCSWKDPLLSLRKDCSAWGKGSRQRTSGKCLLLSAPVFWSMDFWDHPPSPMPTWGSPYQAVGTKSQELSTHLPQLCCTPQSFSFGAHSQPLWKVSPYPLKETKNVCYSATFWKIKGS